jgi:uncharacterized cupin superfamily protein
LIVHWDDVEPSRRDIGPLRFDRFDLGTAAGSVTVGVTREQVDPGGHSSPLHVEGAEEEIFYVLAGSGLSVQDDGETRHAHEVGPGDCLVHLVGEEAHTLVAGPDGLDVLAFGERSDPTLTYLPRAGVVRMGVTLEVPEGPHPFEREAAAGELDLPETSERPPSIVNVADVDVLERHRETTHSDWRDLGRAAGSVRTGLKHITVSPGKLTAPPHCHSAEEELFVVLEGDGELELLPAPYVPWGAEAEQHPVRAGSVVARPAGTRIAHTFRAGRDGLNLLAYGTRDPSDIAYYPRSRKLFLRGAGVIVRAEHVDYWEGEE